MAEPEDSINAIGSGPIYWYRFAEASAGALTNSGSGDATAFSVVGIDVTYQHSVNSFGEANRGILAPPSASIGGLESASPLSGFTTNGTMMVVIRSITGTPSSALFFAGVSDGAFDDDYIDFRPIPGGAFQYHTQDAFTGDTSWTYNDSGPDAADGNHHSLAVVGSDNPSNPPQLFFDAVEDTTLAESLGTTPRDFWVHDFTGGDRISLFQRDGVGGVDHFEWVIYEFLCWNERLTPAQVQDAHNVLFNQIPITSKTIRRNNRRLYGF